MREFRAVIMSAVSFADSTDEVGPYLNKMTVTLRNLKSFPQTYVDCIAVHYFF
jgi:hypothetical protein